MSDLNPFRRNAHAVIIGINKYQDEKIPDLKLARADAEAVYQILTDPELGRISPDHIILLLDEQATQRNIRSAIGTKIPHRAGEQDMVLIYYAGHGVPVINPKTRAHDGMEKYLAPADAELDDLRATGIAMDEIQKFFGYIESRQVMFFIDSCYSGEAGGRTFQHPLYQKRAALTNEFLDDLASEGRMVLTACDVNEVSLEIKNLGHGLFTYHLLEGLKGVADKDQDGLVTIHELYDYVYEQVSQQARRMGGSMHPVQKGSLKGKIFLTQYESAAQKQARALHHQAQSSSDAGKFAAAYDLWQQVIKLSPEHESAKLRIAEIDDRRLAEQRKAQEILEQRQAILLNLYHEGKLPSDEFELSLALIEKKENELVALERKTRKLLDDLIDEKISVSSYLKSVGLLRKPAVFKKPMSAPPAEPSAEKEESAAIKTPPRKTAKVEKAAPKPQAAPKKSVVQKIQLPPISKIQLRSQPAYLAEDDVKKMLKKRNFFDKDWNEPGKGLQHYYEVIEPSEAKLVIDHATGLMWQQSGAPNRLEYSEASNYIYQTLNGKNYAGHKDWRLPTLEEAMSLMAPQDKNGGLYIDPVFDQAQRWIWTADQERSNTTWVVFFDSGRCYSSLVYISNNMSSVRAVRSVN